ncbi:hypothetical protein B0H14DRAFT_3707334 [Mycena olivaceomarginata]|nr:hypothetical protein B0H14DRAFT_3707334 [Mycena olivaceomarginata]
MPIFWIISHTVPSSRTSHRSRRTQPLLSSLHVPPSAPSVPPSRAHLISTLWSVLSVGTDARHMEAVASMVNTLVDFFDEGEQSEVVRSAWQWQGFEIEAQAQAQESANDGVLIWRLLDIIQEKENFIVLFDKQDPKQNTSGDNKITIYERIAAKLFPEDFQDHPRTLGKRVKGKADDLCKIYKEKSSLLHQTGGGVGAPEDEDATGVHHYLNYYIPTTVCTMIRPLRP